MSKQITLTIRGTELTFEPNLTAYNKMLSEAGKNQGKEMVAASESYLKRIVIKEHKEALDELLSIPSASLQIAGKVNEIYAPELEIEVKE